MKEIEDLNSRYTLLLEQVMTIFDCSDGADHPDEGNWNKRNDANGVEHLIAVKREKGLNGSRSKSFYDKKIELYKEKIKI